MKIMWCMIPEIWSATDIIFFSFWTIFCPFTPPPPNNPEKKIVWKNFTQVYHKWQSCDIWFLRYEVQQTELVCHHGPVFALLLSNSPKNQNFKKMKKTPGNIIILHKCTKSHDHIAILFLRYGTRWMQLLFFIFGCFLPFYPSPRKRLQATASAFTLKDNTPLFH